jgi:hypothetical protein
MCRGPIGISGPLLETMAPFKGARKGERLPHPKLRIRPRARMNRAKIVSTLALLLTHAFHLPRGYRGLFRPCSFELFVYLKRRLSSAISWKA